MAELSLETEAIIDRLRAEGDLLRNSGKNSIREVKVRLDKFEGTFNNISLKMGETARALGSLESIFTGNLTRVTEQLEEANEQAREQAQEEQAQENETTRQNREREREGYLRNPLEGFKGIFGSLKDTLVDFRKKPAEGFIKFAKYAFLAPILAGAVKGALDLIFPGWMDSPFVNFIKDNPWTSFGIALVAFAGLDWVAIGASILSAMASLKAMAAVNSGGGTDVIGAPGGDDKGKGKKGSRLKNFLKGNKGKVGLILAGTGLLLYGNEFFDGDDVEDVKGEVERINKEATADEQAVIDERLTSFEKERTGLGDALIDATAGAGIGFLTGGPIGALVGAAGGLAFSLIGRTWEAIDDSMNDIDAVPNDVEEALRKETAALNRRRNKLTAEQQVELYKNTSKAIEGTIKDLTTQTETMDTDIAALEAGLEGEGVTRTSGSGRSKRTITEYDVNGEMLTRNEIEKRLQDLKNERVLREEQLVASKRILELREKEAEAVEEQVNTVEQATDTVAKKVNESLNGSTDPAVVEPETTERERRQTVASGGIALNVVNNYYTKGGDTQISQQSDNRSAVTKNSAVAFGGGGGGGRFGGNLPNGSSMA